MEFKLEEGVLFASPTGQPDLQLKPVSDTSFNYIGVEASLVFHADEEGNYTRAIHTQGGSDYEFVRFPPFDPSLEELAEYTGSYFSEELETYYTLTVKDSVLTARHRNMEDITLTPAEEDSFTGSVYFMGDVAFQRNEQRDVVAFTISSGRTKGVLFERR
jgi:hypothetical protein